MIKQFTGIFLLIILTLNVCAQTTETPQTQKTSARPDIPGTFTLELGLNRGLSAPDEFSLGLWGSRTINVYYQYELRILKSRFSLVPGIGLSLERYKFKNGYTLNYSGNSTDLVIMLSTVQSAIPGLKKSQLITNYIDVPVEIRYSTNPEDPARSFKASIGGRIGYMYDAFSKVKYKENGEVKKIKDKQNFNVNQLRYGVFAKIGVGNFSIFSYYNITPLFEEDKGLYEKGESNNFNTFTVGISLSSF